MNGKAVLFDSNSNRSLLELRTAATEGTLERDADENNNITGVIVPIDQWREIQSEKETAYRMETVEGKTSEKSYWMTTP